MYEYGVDLSKFHYSCGKTTLCQLFASILGRKLYSINCHMHTEAADFLGGLRPARRRQVDDENDNDDDNVRMHTHTHIYTCIHTCIQIHTCL